MLLADCCECDSLDDSIGGWLQSAWRRAAPRSVGLCSSSRWAAAAALLRGLLCMEGGPRLLAGEGLIAATRFTVARRGLKAICLHTAFAGSQDGLHSGSGWQRAGGAGTDGGSRRLGHPPRLHCWCAAAVLVHDAAALPLGVPGIPHAFVVGALLLLCLLGGAAALLPGVLRCWVCWTFLMPSLSVCAAACCAAGLARMGCSTLQCCCFIQELPHSAPTYAALPANGGPCSPSPNATCCRAASPATTCRRKRHDPAPRPPNGASLCTTAGPSMQPGGSSSGGRGGRRERHGCVSTQAGAPAAAGYSRQGRADGDAGEWAVLPLAAGCRALHWMGGQERVVGRNRHPLACIGCLQTCKLTLQLAAAACPTTCRCGS